MQPARIAPAEAHDRFEAIGDDLPDAHGVTRDVVPEAGEAALGFVEIAAMERNRDHRVRQGIRKGEGLAVGFGLDERAPRRRDGVIRPSLEPQDVREGAACRDQAVILQPPAGTVTAGRTGQQALRCPRASSRRPR